MKGDPEERAIAVGRYIAGTGATVRAAAVVFGVSKSTIWKDQARLRRTSPGSRARTLSFSGLMRFSSLSEKEPNSFSKKDIIKSPVFSAARDRAAI